MELGKPWLAMADSVLSCRHPQSIAKLFAHRTMCPPLLCRALGWGPALGWNTLAAAPRSVVCEARTARGAAGPGRRPLDGRPAHGARRGGSITGAPGARGYQGTSAELLGPPQLAGQVGGHESQRRQSTHCRERRLLLQRLPASLLLLGPFRLVLLCFTKRLFSCGGDLLYRNFHPSSSTVSISLIFHLCCPPVAALTSRAAPSPPATSPTLTGEGGWLSLRSTGGGRLATVEVVKALGLGLCSYSGAVGEDEDGVSSATGVNSFNSMTAWEIQCQAGDGEA